MTRIISNFANKRNLSIYGTKIEDEKTKKCKLSLWVADEEGVIHSIGCFTANEVRKGRAKQCITDVFPEMLFETQDDEMEEIQNQLIDILRSQKAVRSKTAMDIRMVHQEVCDYVGRNKRTDYYEIVNGKCQIRYDELDNVLGRLLNTGWKHLEFAKALASHGMVDEGNDRLPKKLTDSTGEQYRALVFDVEFKPMGA